MITLTKQQAIELVRNYLNWDEQAEHDLLEGCKWWLERKSLDLVDEEFCRRWIGLSQCKTLEEAPEEFYQELFNDPGTTSWLINARCP